MPNLFYENQGTNTYLVYAVDANDSVDSMSIGMLTNNSIPGFAPAVFMQMDMAKYIKYNVSAKVSAKQLFNGPVNKKRLIGVFSGIVEAMLSAEDYMLDPNCILLDLDYIFADVSTCETVLVCLPVMNGEHKNPELGMFFKNIIFNTQFDQTENCDHVAQILNYLNSSPVLSLVDFKELLDKIGKGNEPVKSVQPKVIAKEPVRAEAAPNPVPQTAGQTVHSGAAIKQPQPTVNPKHEGTQFGTNTNKPPVVPPTAPVKPDPVAPQGPQAKGEKTMSMFYLLQHYNKENAAIYKAQQEAKKTKKSGTAAPKAQPAQPPIAPKQANAGFAIPGKQEAVSPGFAVPGQQQPVAPVQKHEQPVVMPSPKPVVPKQEAAPVYQQPAPVSRPINFGETTVLGGAIGETTVLGGASEAVKKDPYIIRTKNNEMIPLNKPVFRIGKERSYVDYFISDNTAISRSHANIINHNGEFFVVDTNSTNHTYVNGGMIPSGVETKLSHGTKIRFANEDFEFRMY